MKPSWRQATVASTLSKLEVQTAPHAPSEKTCRAPVAKPLTSTLLTILTAPSCPAPTITFAMAAHIGMYNTASWLDDN